MEPIPDRDKFISHYEYCGPNGERIRLERDEVIQLRMPNPLDPYRGLGPVQSILVDLDSSRYSAEWNRNFFANSAEPGGVIEVDKRLSDDEFDEMNTRWGEQHKGVSNAHRVAIIEHGAKWVDRKYTMRDMQFAELRGVSRDVIREAFGIPKFAVGDVDDVNRATADASSAWFAEHLTVPRLERIKAALNHDFLPLFGATAAGLEFDYCSPVKGDREADDRERESKAQAASVLVTAGWEPTAVLEAVDLPPMPYIGTRSATTIDPGGQTGPTPPAPAAAHRYRHQPRNQDDDEREQWEDDLDQLIADWQDEVTPDQVDEIADQVEAAVDDGDLEALADLDVSTEVAAGLLAAAMIAVAVAAAQSVLDEAADAGVKTPDVTIDEDTLRQQASVRAALMGRSLAETCGREAVRVATPGVSGSEVAAAVRTHIAGMSDRWLADQLGAAVWHAVHEGRFTTFAAIDNTLTAKLTYVADERRDRNTCRNCRKINGREYDSLEAARVDYPTSGYRDCDGGVRCRGTINAVWIVD
jgi:HK97 family phage portal protein